MVHGIADCDGLRRTMLGHSDAQLPDWPGWLSRRLGTGCGNAGASNMDAWDGRLLAWASSGGARWEDRTVLASRACGFRTIRAGIRCHCSRLRDHGSIRRSAMPSGNPSVRAVRRPAEGIRRDSPTGSNSDPAADTCSALGCSGKVFPGASGPRWRTVAALHLQPCSGGWCGGLPPSSGRAGPHGAGRASDRELRRQLRAVRRRDRKSCGVAQWGGRLSVSDVY